MSLQPLSNILTIACDIYCAIQNYQTLEQFLKSLYVLLLGFLGTTYYLEFQITI